MAQKLIAMNGSGIKSINPWDIDGNPEAWTWFSGQSKTQQDDYYARVSAAYRAWNLKANTIASIPFALMKGKQEFDNSNEWQNKVKFLPNPQEVLRLAVLSYISSNAIYILKTSDVIGYRTRGLYNAISSSFTPVVNPSNAQLDYIDRRIGAHTERYTPDDKRLIRLWRLDHTTEVLPSQNTEARAMLSSAGIIKHQDAWVEHFYKQGGIKPTIIGLQGLVDKDTKKDQETAWAKFFKGIGDRFGKPAKIVNADAVKVDTVGAGVDDMKDNNIYQKAIENIAMSHGMPLSLLLANSANYATAQEEKATWYENDIIPFARWLAYGLNTQLWDEMGLEMVFQPQTLDPNQQDETEKADAISQYIDIIVKCPTYDLFIGMADTIGIEISDTLNAALKKYYADKEAKIEQGKLDANGQVIEVQPVDEKEEDPEDADDLAKPAKWIPSLNHFEEMRVWREVSHRRNKKGESLDFEYHWHKGGLPEFATEFIKAGLLIAATPEEIDKAFDISEITAKSDMLFAPSIVEKSNDDILALAAALNRNADAMFASAGSHKESDK
jgi:hypothetical protein